MNEKMYLQFRDKEGEIDTLKTKIAETEVEIQQLKE
jgi:hypothetical protein